MSIGFFYTVVKGCGALIEESLYTSDFTIKTAKYLLF